LGGAAHDAPRSLSLSLSRSLALAFWLSLSLFLSLSPSLSPSRSLSLPACVSLSLALCAFLSLSLYLSPSIPPSLRLSLTLTTHDPPRSMGGGATQEASSHLASLAEQVDPYLIAASIPLFLSLRFHFYFETSPLSTFVSASSALIMVNTSIHSTNLYQMLFFNDSYVPGVE
jgi:hypothetical protein